MTLPDGRPLRVAMVTARYLPERGGTAIHTHEVAKRLAAAGVNVTLLTTTFAADDVGSSHDDGFEVVRVRAWPARTDYYFAPGLRAELRSREFDLVHLQGYHTLVAPTTLMAANGRRIPFVVTFHSGGHSSALRRAIRPLQIRLLRPLMKRAAALLAVSEFEADLFAQRLGLPRDALTVIPSGVELPDEEEGVIAETEPLIVCVGRVESYKGHHRVIEALPAIRAARPDMRVRVLGSGPYEGVLRELANDLSVGQAVEIAPIAAEHRSELAALLRRAAVVALLSEYESQGLAAHEALALGRPLVVNDSGALAELRGLPNVRLVAPSAPAAAVAQAILESADTPLLPPAPYPTWANCVAAVLEVYERALG